MLYLLRPDKASQRQDFIKHKLQNGETQREHCTMTATKGSGRQNASHLGVSMGLVTARVFVQVQLFLLAHPFLSH